MGSHTLCLIKKTLMHERNQFKESRQVIPLPEHSLSMEHSLNAWDLVFLSFSLYRILTSRILTLGF